MATDATPNSRKPFIETRDGTNLFCSDWGTGKPVVFTHAWALNSDIWEYQRTYLAGQGLRCVAYDRRGHGRSSDPGRGYDFDTFADDLAAVIEERDLRDVTLVGFSMGGGEVARYLSRHGTSRVARAVLISPVTPFLLKTSDNPDGIDKSVFDGLIAALSKDRPAVFGRGIARFFGNAPVSAEMKQWVVAMFLRASPQATIDCVRAYSETDFRVDMRAFTIPTVIIHGDADEANPIDKSGRKSAQAIPGSRLAVYEGAPHGLVITDKDRLNRDLLEVTRGRAANS